MARDIVNTTPVDVKTIFNDTTWDNLLSGIAAIQGQNFEKIKKALNEQQRSSEQQSIDEEVRSINAERNNRAVNNALFGKLDKQVSVMDKLTDCLKEIGERILDMLKNMAKQSLQAYDEAVRGQRQQLLTTKQIKENTLKADYGREYLEKKGIKISGGEISSLLPELAALGEDISTLSKEQLANMALIKKTAGVDTKTALLLARSVKNQEAFTKFATNASDTTGRATTAAILSQINEAWFQRASSTFGGQEEMLTMIQNTAKSMDSMLGHYGLNADSQKNLINTTLKIASGQIEKVKEDEIANALMISGDAMRSPEKLLAGLENLITNQNMSMSQKINRLRVLENVEGIDQSIIDAVTLAIEAQAEGKYKKKGIRSEEDNKEAINQAQKGGKLGGFIDSLISGVNTATGGMLSDLSATLNEYFGENASMEALVSTGFKMVATLLGTIIASQLIGNPLKLIGGAISKGILSSAGSVLARLGAGLAAKIAPLAAALGPITAALVGIAAVVGVGTAFYKWTKDRDTEREEKRSKLSELDKAVQDKALLEADLQLAEQKGDTRAVGVIKSKIADADKRIEALQKQVKIAARIVELNDQDAKLNFTHIQSKENEVKELLDKRQRLELAGDAVGVKDIDQKLKSIGGGIEYISQAARKINLITKDAEDIEKNSYQREVYRRSTFDDVYLTWDKETADKFFETVSRSIPKYEDLKNNPLASKYENLFNAINARAYGVDSVPSFNGLTPSQKTALYNNAPNVIANELKAAIANAKTAEEHLFLSDVVDSLRDTKELYSSNVILSKESHKTQQELLSNSRALNENFRKNVVMIKAFAKGGIVDKATPSLVGEAGKEAILPLTRKNDLARVLMSLNNDEKLNILRVILGHPSVRSMNGIFAILERILFNKFSFGQYKQPKTTQQKTQPQDNQQLPTIPDGTFAPGDDPDTINKILSYASPEYRNILAQKLIDGRKKRKKWFDESLANASNTSGRDLIRGTYAERALAAGVSQLGKPYILRSLGNIGYVCNELTDYAMRKSGFDMKDFRIYSVGQTFSNLVNGRTGTIKRGARKGQKKEFPEFRLRPDLTPETAPPGMVFFSKKSKDALPGHIGLVYYNHKILHSSGGSSNYTPGGFLQGWQIPCRGVSVTDYNKSQHYEFGEFPGLFEKANGEFAGDINSSFGPMAELSKTKSNLDTQLEEQKRMAKEAMNAVIANTSGEVRKAAMQYAEQAMKLLDGKNTKDVIDSLGRIIQYLRSIAASTKSPTPNVSRAPVVKY